MTGWPKGGTRERHEAATDTKVVPLADVGLSDIEGAPSASRARETAGGSSDVDQDERTERVWKWAISVEGTCTRSSTTATDRRRDALLSATRFVEAAKRIVRSEPTRVTGSIVHALRQTSAPNGDGDGRFELSLELRDADPATIGRVYERIAAEAWTIGRLSQTRLTLTPNESNPSVLYDVRTQSVTVPQLSLSHSAQRSSPPAADAHVAGQGLRLG